MKINKTYWRYNMKKLVAIIAIITLGVMLTLTLSACEMTSTDGNKADREKLIEIGSTLADNQPAPTDLDYSLERYNLIRRAYWVNGQREKAIALPCAITRPLGYIVLFTNSGSIVGRFIVDGKVTSLNSYLIPISEYYEEYAGSTSTSKNNNEWMPDVDGTYGDNVAGIFFFTTDGKYVEWTGDFLYSDIPFEVDDPVLQVGGNE